MAKLKIFEALFVQEFCTNTKSKVLFTKKTLMNKSMWKIVPLKDGLIAGAEVYTKDDGLFCVFTKDGRKVAAGFDLDLNIQYLDTGFWDETQKDDELAFIEEVKSYFPSQEAIE